MITVLDAPGDSEMRFQNPGPVWNRAINDAALAYCYNDYTEARMQFIPTARDCGREVLARRPNPLLTKIPPELRSPKCPPLTTIVSLGLRPGSCGRSGSDSEDRTRTEWIRCKKQTLTDWL